MLFIPQFVIPMKVQSLITRPMNFANFTQVCEGFSVIFHNTVQPLLTDTSILWTVQLVLERSTFVQTVPLEWAYLCNTDTKLGPFGVHIKEVQQ